MWNGGLAPHHPRHCGSSCQPGVAELAGSHDLGPNPVLVAPRERLIDAVAAAALAHDLAPEAGRNQPFVQPMSGVTERRLAAQALTGAETVERDGEVVDTHE